MNAQVQIRAVEKRKEMRDDNEDGTNPRELTKEVRVRQWTQYEDLSLALGLCRHAKACLA